MTTGASQFTRIPQPDIGRMPEFKVNIPISASFLYGVINLSEAIIPKVYCKFLDFQLNEILSKCQQNCFNFTTEQYQYI